MAIVMCFLLILGGQQQGLSKEEIARGLYNQALLENDIDKSDKLLERIIKDYPATAVATEAIKLVKARQAARAQAVAETVRAQAALESDKRRLRQEALGGFQISEIMVHDLRVPIPNGSSTRRSGMNPEIIKLAPSSGNSQAVMRFFSTALPEFKWKPMEGVATRCWTQVNAKADRTERLCFDVDDPFGNASIYVTTVKQ
jgi:hypothetical protein